ncbi:hypothetical protein EV144_105437 [Flavobacterium sp. 270]|uniref:tetratricopeptide repeat protein n=1 Tax=Flavobacterium sp. 270 TaxID=2512114 RepID=UPI001064C1F1|nr:tetratricopeptide repeat protein [Flavobacterium sp. 270]TDW47410.1 hypothetical protein EV144_105437 [Flavobacterium sp. 270]
MKNHKPYKEIKPVYFNLNEFLVFPIFATIIPSLISYGLLFIGGVSFVVVFNLVISFIGYFYFHYYGKSSQNISAEFVFGWMLVCGYFLFVDYGLYLLFQYQHTNYFNKLHFYIWAFIVFGLPVLYFVFNDIRYNFIRWRLAVNYIKTRISIFHDPELLIYIDKIEFVNTNTNRISNIKIERDQYQALTAQIPVNSNLFRVSWYSFIEDKYYDAELEFPYDKLILTAVKYPTNEPAVFRGIETKSLYLHISLNGEIELLNKETHLLKPSNTKSIIITEEQKESRINNYIYTSSVRNKEEFSTLIEEIKKSKRLEEKIETQQKQFVWDISFEGLHEGNKLEIYDALPIHHEIASDINILNLKYLPRKIDIYYRPYTWANIQIDIIKLCKLLESVLEHKDAPISFLLVFENNETELKFFIKTGDQKIEFKDWTFDINEYHKKSVDEKINESKQHQLKNDLYQSAWPLIYAKDYPAAQKICDQLISENPEFGIAYFLEARLLWYTQGSQACYDKLDYFIEKTKHDSFALAHMYNNFGCLLDLDHRLEEALEYFKKATAINPNEGTYQCNIAEMYCKLKEPEKAMFYALESQEKGHKSDILNEILESKGHKVF